MKRITAIVLSICFALSFTSCSSTRTLGKVQAADSKKIIVCANSMVYYGGCVRKGNPGQADDGMLSKMLDAGGFSATVVDNTFGGHHLRDYLEAGCQIPGGGNSGSGCPGQGQDLLKGLDLGSFDYVVISEAGNNTVDFYECAAALYKRFTDENPNAKLFYVNHIYSVFKKHDHVLDGLKRLHDELGVTIVNCGQLAYDLYTGTVKVPNSTLTYSDKYTFCNHAPSDSHHPNPLMGYIMSQMLYCALTGDTAPYSDYQSLLKTCYYGDGTVILDNYYSKYYTTSAALPFTTVLQNKNEMSGIQQLIPSYINRF